MEKIKIDDQWSILRMVLISRFGDKIRLKNYVNPIETAVNRVILRAKDFLRVTIKINLYFTSYVTMHD